MYNTVVELQRSCVMEPYAKLLVQDPVAAGSSARSLNDDSVNVATEVAADVNAYFQCRRPS